MLKLATSRSFFGFSAKQGVSVRYPLLSCVPTASCGGRCYAHDGRDRELHLLFRALLNYYAGAAFEHGDVKLREQIMTALYPAIDAAVAAAAPADQQSAEALGYAREPRIRFSVIGEMIVTPEFLFRLGDEITKRDPRIALIIYTRHPEARRLVASKFRVNFTLDGPSDPRSSFAPAHARLVSSAWDGITSEHVSVNFLEHHVEKHAAAAGGGFVCPVTSHHDETPSCDTARCHVCFEATASITGPPHQCMPELIWPATKVPILS